MNILCAVNSLLHVNGEVGCEQFSNSLLCTKTKSKIFSFLHFFLEFSCYSLGYCMHDQGWEKKYFGNVIGYR